MRCMPRLIRTSILISPTRHLLSARLMPESAVVDVTEPFVPLWRAGSGTRTRHPVSAPEGRAGRSPPRPPAPHRVALVRIVAGYGRARPPAWLQTRRDTAGARRRIWTGWCEPGNSRRPAPPGSAFRDRQPSASPPGDGTQGGSPCRTADPRPSFDTPPDRTTPVRPTPSNAHLLGHSSAFGLLRNAAFNQRIQPPRSSSGGQGRA